jgi:hypothetical protein
MKSDLEVQLLSDLGLLEPGDLITVHTTREYYSNAESPYAGYDWQAYDYDRYEPGQPLGFGRTEREATIDLLSQIADSSDEEYARRADAILEVLSRQ